MSLDVDLILNWLFALKVANNQCRYIGYKPLMDKEVVYLPVFGGGRYGHTVRQQPTADGAREVREGPPAPERHICWACHEFRRPQPRTSVGVLVPGVPGVGAKSRAQSIFLQAVRTSQLEERRVIQTSGHKCRSHNELALPRHRVDQGTGRRVEGENASRQHVTVRHQQAPGQYVHQTCRKVKLGAVSCFWEQAVTRATEYCAYLIMRAGCNTSEWIQCPFHCGRKILV
jgi:hypothetical protein